MTRSAADIGAGLAPARVARAVRREHIHVVGVAGAGASAAALLARAAGAEVSGCDPGGPSPYTAALEAAGVELAWEHGAEHVARWRPARLAVTTALTAVRPDHPELEAARAAGVPLERWQQVVADVAASTGQRLVAVAGTHGKSTTTSWLVRLLAAAGRDPSAFVGALLPPDVAGALGGGHRAPARWGRGPDFVVEADEYAGNFDAFRPAVIVLVSAEWDHPDVFADEDAVVGAFEAWIRAAGPRPLLVANLANAGVRAVVERVRPRPERLVGFGLVEGPDAATSRRRADLSLAGAIVAADPSGTSLLVGGLGDGALRIRLRVPGRHNAEDALAVAAASHALGLAPDEIVTGLEAFTGTWRRLELKGEVGGVAVLDDYGHHPTAIRATLEAARQRYPGRRLWAVYEPLTYHRTAVMLDAFAAVLATADRVAVADIHAVRDPDTTIVTAADLAAATARRGGAPAVAPGSVEATADHLAGAVEAGDVVVVMGGGRSYVTAERLLVLLQAREPAARRARRSSSPGRPRSAAATARAPRR